MHLPHQQGNVLSGWGPPGPPSLWANGVVTIDPLRWSVVDKSLFHEQLHGLITGDFRVARKEGLPIGYGIVSASLLEHSC